MMSFDQLSQRGGAAGVQGGMINSMRKLMYFLFLLNELPKICKGLLKLGHCFLLAERERLVWNSLGVQSFMLFSVSWEENDISFFQWEFLWMCLIIFFFSPLFTLLTQCRRHHFNTIHDWDSSLEYSQSIKRFTENQSAGRLYNPLLSIFKNSSFFTSILQYWNITVSSTIKYFFLLSTRFGNPNHLFYIYTTHH